MRVFNITYLLVFAMLLWGGGWSALKVLTYNTPADVIVFWRFFFMSLSFLPILYILKIPFKFEKKSVIFVTSGAFLNIAFMVSAFFGIKYGFAGAGSVAITTLSPIMTFLLVSIIFRKKITPIKLFGLFLGLVGGAILLELNNLELFLDGANLFFLLCALVWGGITLLSQHSQRYIHPIYYSFFISVFATCITFLYVVSSDFMVVFEQGWQFWFALLYLSVLGQSVATTIFFIASGKIGSEKTSSFMFLVPVFALSISYIVLDEELQLHTVVGGVVSMLAVFFINKKELK